MSPSSDDRAAPETVEAIRACVEELGKLPPDYQRAQVHATLSLREAVAEVAKQIRLASRR